MGFSETFLRGFQTGAQAKLQKEAAAQQTLRDKQQADLQLEELKLRQAAARIQQQRAQFDAELHPLELEQKIQEAGLVPADVEGGASGVGAAGTLPPLASPGSAPGAPPSAPVGGGVEGTSPVSPEPAPRTLSDVLNIGGKSFRRKTLSEKLNEMRQATMTKVGAEAEAKAQYDYLPEDVRVNVAGQEIVIPKGTPLNLAPGIVSGTTQTRISAADNATSRANALTAAEVAREGMDYKRQADADKLVKTPYGQVRKSEVGALLDSMGRVVNGVRVFPPELVGHAKTLALQADVLKRGAKHIETMLDDPKVRKLLGPLEGRVVGDLGTFIGFLPPELSELAGALDGFAKTTVSVHGMRSAEESRRTFDEHLGFRFTPEALKGAVRGFAAIPDAWIEVGQEHGLLTGPGVTPSGSDPAKPRFVIKSVK